MLEIVIKDAIPKLHVRFEKNRWFVHAYFWLIPRIMGSNRDQLEAQFDEDMKKALALSLETHALEEMMKSKDAAGKIF